MPKWRLLLLLLFYYEHEDILVTLNFFTLHLGRRLLDALFIINVFKGNIVAHLFWMLLVSACPLGQSDTTLLLLCIVTSRPVPQPDVFLLPMQSVSL
jgi:hypothetical protein